MFICNWTEVWAWGSISKLCVSVWSPQWSHKYDIFCCCWCKWWMEKGFQCTEHHFSVQSRSHNKNQMQDTCSYYCEPSHWNCTESELKNVAQISNMPLLSPASASVSLLLSTLFPLFPPLYCFVFLSSHISPFLSLIFHSLIRLSPHPCLSLSIRPAVLPSFPLVLHALLLQPPG